MYNDIDKKFDIATKKALPYLVLAPPAFRKEISELMEALFHQLLQRSESDFETHYAQINDMIDNRNKFESNLEVRVHNFARRFISQEETISLMDIQLVKLENRAAKSERKIKSLEKSVKNRPPKDNLSDNLSDNHGLPGDNRSNNHGLPGDNAEKLHICTLCGATLTRKTLLYYPSLDKTLMKCMCPVCRLCFKFDVATGDTVPMRRQKGTLERAEQRRNKR
jgi:uncharacterized coiled-coil protein SlyX